MLNIEKFERLNHRISAAAEWVGVIGFLAMMLITTVDVIGAKIFLRPVPGALDIVVLVQLTAMSFAASMTLIIGRHVAVEFFFPLLPKPLQTAVDTFVNILGLGLFIILVWHLGKYAHSLQIEHETTPTIRIPLYPFMYGAAFACIPVCLVYFSSLIKSILRIVKP
ncbi:MAG: TRAP transporter small permease [Deltaproteobacteria bacterium]|nr:TRAP transporter small permease [Deltaproteobacteria bacterium]